MLLTQTCTALAVVPLPEGVPFTPDEPGLFFTESEARMEYQQKHTAIEQLELALDVIETRDEMFERLNKEFEDYVKADKKEDAVINDKINKLERQNKILSWASILILAAAAFE
jgi:hypothetical protein